MQDLIERVPPCKILFQNGQPTDLVVTERLRPVENLKRVAIEPAVLKRPERVVLAPRMVRVPRETHQRAPRPTRAPEKRGSADWCTFHHVTLELILEMQKQNLTAQEIADKLDCSRDLVYKRLRVARRTRSEYAKIHEEIRVCACGNRKLACRMQCNICTSAARHKKRRQEIKRATPCEGGPRANVMDEKPTVDAILPELSHAEAEGSPSA